MIHATSTLILNGINASSTTLAILQDATLFPLVIILIGLWVIPWKGYALWRAAKNNHKKWFIAILLLNTLAILEIVYIFTANKKARKENKND